MKCLSTRTTPNGLKRRRYLLDDGRRLTTYEVPASVLGAMGSKTLREAMAKFQRGEELRARAKQLRDFVANHPDWKPTAIANHMGCTEQRVRQIRKELQAE